MLLDIKKSNKTLVTQTNKTVIRTQNKTEAL